MTEKKTQNLLHQIDTFCYVITYQMISSERRIDGNDSRQDEKWPTGACG